MANIGVHFPKGGLNVAYMRRPFRDLEETFGKSEVYMASGYLNF